MGRREGLRGQRAAGRPEPRPGIVRAFESFRAGDLEAARRACRKALVLRPNDAAALHILGAIEARQGRYGDAIVQLRRSVRADPGDPEAHRNLGTCLLELGRIEEAIAAFRRALSLAPRDIATLNNLGNALGRTGAHAEAARHYEQALALAPSRADLHVNLAGARRSLERYDEAIASLERVLELDPARLDALTLLIQVRLHACRWQGLDELSARADTLLGTALEGDGEIPETPLANLARRDDPALNLAVARHYARRLARRIESVPRRMAAPPRTRDRITVGYLSAACRRHPTGHLTRRLFGLHDRDRFRVHVYAAGPDDGSDVRREIAAGSDAFVDLGMLEPAAIADRIARDRVDVLVEIDGHTSDSRLAACAFRPAPIIASWLGFPGTSGADFIDYIITDRIVSPPEHEEFYSERLVYLPHCYQVNDDRPPVGAVPSRGDLGLPEEGPLLCCFNRPHKLDPVMFGMWMRVLRQLPSAVLWLGPAREPARANLRRDAAARGVAPDRLVFADRVPREEHLARVGLADLALDTRIYNGHTTTSEALWAGVPVVTLVGRHFAARVSASLLTAIGLPELVTESPEACEALVLRLAGRPEMLAALRQKLASSRRTRPLFDTAGFARGLEAAFRRMVEIHDAGEAPRAIDLTAPA
jgi:protein O-GlcNAc transferase